LIDDRGSASRPRDRHRAGSRLAGRVLVDDVPVPEELASRLQIVALPMLPRGISQQIQSRADLSHETDRLSSLRQRPRLIRVYGFSAGTWTLQRVVALGADVTDSGVEVGPEGITGIEVG
jgi:hypothetical protein